MNPVSSRFRTAISTPSNRTHPVCTGIGPDFSDRVLTPFCRDVDAKTDTENVRSNLEDDEILCGAAYNYPLADSTST